LFVLVCPWLKLKTLQVCFRCNGTEGGEVKLFQDSLEDFFGFGFIRYMGSGKKGQLMTELISTLWGSLCGEIIYLALTWCLSFQIICFVCPLIY
jgi:hypothetical protein